MPEGQLVMDVVLDLDFSKVYDFKLKNMNSNMFQNHLAITYQTPTALLPTSIQPKPLSHFPNTQTKTETPETTTDALKPRSLFL